MLQIRQAAGQNAGAIKYDVLSALLVLASRDRGPQARLALRLSLLITSRYNWRSGTFCVGQREMARMWGVTERTAKREMAAMRALGWIVVLRPAARGRVAEHGIDLSQVLAATQPLWADIGPDFAARMAGPGGEAAADGPADLPSNVVQLRPVQGAAAAQGTVWQAMSERLAAAHPATHAAWFAQLVQRDLSGGVLTLAARSGFVADYVRQHFLHRIMAATGGLHPAVQEVRVVAITG